MHDVRARGPVPVHVPAGALSLAALSVFAVIILAFPGRATANEIGHGAWFRIGAAVTDFTPPLRGQLASDPADCAPATDTTYTGPREFAFEEPYADLQGTGHYDPGDPYLDCNGNGRWDGNLLGGGSQTPRFYDHVADPVTARAMVVSNGHRTIAIEVTDQEGLFSAYQERIRARVRADGYHLDGIFISATHDESAPDSLGLGGVDPYISGTNDYFVDYLVEKSARAIEKAYRRMRPARIRYVEAREPDKLRQCWSSYPYTDNRLMPTLQAVGRGGQVIVTLTSVSQHVETLGFNPDPAQRLWVTSGWPHFFRRTLEQRYGGVAIEMAGSVGSVESPQVFDQALSQIPQRYVDASHPAGCRTLFEAPDASETPLGYDQETRAYGETVAQAVIDALHRDARWSRTTDIWGGHRDVCLSVQNILFKAGGLAGVFAAQPFYMDQCSVKLVPPPYVNATAGSLPSPATTDPTTVALEFKTRVSAFRVGDASFIGLPGEVFPFTYLRGFQGPQDMPRPEYGLPAWPLPHMHTRYRFFDGLAGDMIGYIFPRGNAVGIPGEDPANPFPSTRDRFGCAHSDDPEATSEHAADALAGPLIAILDAHGGRPESIVGGRYVLPDGRLSRDPLGGPEIKCNTDTVFQYAGPAVAVWTRDRGVIRPRAWMSLSGRAQREPDRDTRGYIGWRGRRHWLDVFPPIDGAPARVELGPPTQSRGHHR